MNILDRIVEAYLLGDTKELAILHKKLCTFEPREETKNEA